MITLATRRQLFAEEIEAIANLRTPGLVEALASVPREQFLPPPPWLVTGEGDFANARSLPDSDAGRVYHNYSVAIDPARQLFNGAPGNVAVAIDALGLQSGQRVLHIGAGLGYYTAIMAHVVGPSGHVTAIEVDDALAERARVHLAPLAWVDLRHGDGTGPLEGPFDAIFVSAGVTHPQDAWLEALVNEGRMILPLTATSPAMGATIGKGVLTRLTKRENGAFFDARLLMFISIYSGVGLRDDSLNAQLGQALARGPFQRITRLRRDAHEPNATCWLHAPTFCLASA